jgi:hypothetical protein
MQGGIMDAAAPSWLAALDEDDLHFLRRFLLHSGSLKAVAEEYSVSYPTVRARLDRLIAKAKAAEETQEADPFERKLRLLVADGWLAPNLGKELLTLHRQTLKGKKT